MQPNNTPARRIAETAPVWPIVLATSLIALATLIPTPDAPRSVGPCLLCGNRGLADGLLNLVLFLPFGALIALRYSNHPAPVTRAFVTGFALSASIELLQLVIPGRDSTLGDVVFNSAGSGLGGWLALHAGAWVFPADRVRRTLCSAIVALAIAGMSLVGFLTRLTVPNVLLYGQWTPEFGNMEQYGGRVLDASVNEIRAPNNRIRRWQELRAALLQGKPVRVTAVAGEAPAELAPIFNIFDDHQREVILLGAEGNHVIFEYRTISATVRLSQPGLRFREVLKGIAAGDTIHLQIGRARGGFSLRVNEGPERMEGFTVSRGWVILFPLQTHSGQLERVLDLVWVMLLFVPVGFWLFGVKDAVALLAVGVAALAFIPKMTGTLPTAPLDYAALPVGLGVGMLVRKWVTRFERTGPAAWTAPLHSAQQ